MRASDFFGMVFGGEMMTDARRSGIMSALRVKTGESQRIISNYPVASDEFHQFAEGLAEGFTAWKERVPA